MNIGGQEPLAASVPPHAHPEPAGGVAGRENRWLQVPIAAPIVDFCMVVLAVKAAMVLIKLLPQAAGSSFRINAVLAGLLVVGAQAAVGSYDQPGPGPCAKLRLRAISAALFAGFGLQATVPTNGWAASLVFAGLSGGLVMLCGYYGREVLQSVLGHLGQNGRATAIIGTGEEARTIAAGLLAHPEIGLRPVGFIALPDQPAVGMELPLPLLCRLEHAALIEPRIDVAVATRPWRDRAEVETALGPLPFTHIALIKDMKTLHILRLRPEMSITDAKASHRRANGPNTVAARALKRGIDVVLSLPAVLLTLPVILILVALVRFADPGRAIFMQQRIGYGGRSFNVYKIRTMYQDAEERLEKALAADPELAAEWRSNFKLTNDPRILPGVGHVLRRLSLDELPQLWNVLKGEMSLVGPRPFPPYHLKSFDTEFQAIRSTVMPGLTGQWQITSRSDGDLAVQREQDMLYIEHWSFWLDLQILLQTLPAVIRAKGAR